MPRIARALTDNACYHLINRGNGRQQVFHKEGDYCSFIDLLQQARDKFSVLLHAWCLMPNHCHLLVQPEQADQLNKMMQWLQVTTDFWSCDLCNCTQKDLALFPRMP